MGKYVVYAARDEDSNEGWVWINDIPSRTVLKLTCSATPWWKFWRRRSVYCQARKIDENFKCNYNWRCRTVNIGDTADGQSTIVMSGWYRDALGGLNASTKEHKETSDIEIHHCKIPLWRSLRAASHHPEITVRLGTRLGVLGVWLGIVSLFLAIMSILPNSIAGTVCAVLRSLLPAFFAVVVLGFVGVLGIIACRAPKIPSE